MALHWAAMEEEDVGGFLRELLLPPPPLEAYLGDEKVDGEAVSAAPLGAIFFKEGRVIHLPPPLSLPPSELLSA